MLKKELNEKDLEVSGGIWDIIGEPKRRRDGTFEIEVGHLFPEDYDNEDDYLDYNSISPHFYEVLRRYNVSEDEINRAAQHLLSLSANCVNIDQTQICGMAGIIYNGKICLYA